ncbi:hypothetical protein, partial [Qipengyuania sp.]|uniref:hypothetical protein n=1 Tax=Qipengyuania sp. TaxID=2004515 RepID=UPI0035C7F37C
VGMVVWGAITGDVVGCAGAVIASSGGSTITGLVVAAFWANAAVERSAAVAVKASGARRAICVCVIMPKQRATFSARSRHLLFRKLQYIEIAKFIMPKSGQTAGFGRPTDIVSPQSRTLLFAV